MFDFELFAEFRYAFLQVVCFILAMWELLLSRWNENVI